MITSFEIKSREDFVGGAEFGATGAYVRIDGTASGEIDPAHPGNVGIALLDKAPRNAHGRVEYRTDVTILRPANPANGNGRLLYEVNNRGRMMLFPNLCAGAAGNQPKTAADLGNALPLKLGFTLLWSGWDPGAPRANGGLALDAPVATDLAPDAPVATDLAPDAPVATGDGAPIVRRIREEFVSGTRLGVMETFRLSYKAADSRARLTVRASQTAPRQDVDFTFLDTRTIGLLPGGTRPEIGAIYEFTYNATQPFVLGLGFAATRDLVSRLRRDGESLLGFRPTHVLAFGISQAGRYLRDHIALGFNKDERGARVFDGVFTHVAGIGRLFFNTPFAQPARTRTWHEDHDFPEVEFPFSTATFTDPIGGGTASLLRGDDSDPLLIETNTATEYWQKGASLLHTNPEGTHDAVLPDTVRGYFLTGTNHTGRAGVPRDAGPCVLPRNWHDPMAAVRALLVALDEWVVTGRAPPPSRLPRIDDGTLVRTEAVAFPLAPGFAAPHAANDVAPLPDWIDPGVPMRTWRALVPQVGPDGNELAGLKLPDIAVPRGTHTGWNLYKAPYPAGELADRDGTFLAFAATRADREATPDARLSLAERYPTQAAYTAGVETVVAHLRNDRLLLPEDAAAYISRANA
jgi:hypothetical protein